MNIIFPYPAYAGDIFTADNGSVYTYDGVKWVASGTSTGNTVQTYIASGWSNVIVANVNGNIQVNANAAVDQQWLFDTNGNLTLPGNTFSVNYANGLPVQLGGGSGGNGVPGGANTQIQYNNAGSFGATAGFTFDSGSGALNVPGTTTANYFVGDGGLLSNIASGNANIIFNGNSNVSIPVANGNVTINANNGTNYPWIFGADGELYLPSGGRLGFAGKGWTGLDGGNGNPLSLTSYYSDGMYSSCINLNPDGSLYIATYGDGTGQQSNWSFTTANLISIGNSTISIAGASGGLGGDSLTIQAGAADQTSYSTNPGGNLNLSGGLGASNNGGGGGQGGNVNITAGLSADPAGVAGNIVLTSGTDVWTFGNNGNITVPASSVIVPVSGTVGLSTPDGNTLAYVDANGFYIDTLYNTSEFEWHFDNSGNLSTPGAISATGNVIANKFVGNLANISGSVATAQLELGNTVAGPAAGGGSDKVTLYNFYNPSTFNYAIGAESSNIWFGVDQVESGVGFNFYGGNTLAVHIDSTGNITAGNIATTGPTGNITGANVISANTYTSPNANVQLTTSISGANSTITLDQYNNMYFAWNGNSAGSIGFDATSDFYISPSANTFIQSALSVTSNINTSANISGGNVLAGGLYTSAISATGIVYVDSTGKLNGDAAGLSTDGNGNLSAYGNVTAGGFNIAGTGKISTANTLSNVVIETYDTANSITKIWTFGPDGEFYLPTGGSLGPVGKGWTGLGGGNGNPLSLTSYYSDGMYSSCINLNTDGTLYIATYGDGTGQQGNWNFSNTNLTVTGNSTISIANATSGLGGGSLTIQAGASDTVTYNGNPGGNLNIIGGYGSFGDGGGGPGGNVNITGGGSSDSTPGNVNISSASNINIKTYQGAGLAGVWIFDNTGTLTIAGNINGDGASPAPSINGFNSINSLTISAVGNVYGNCVIGNIFDVGSSSIYEAGNLVMQGGTSVLITSPNDTTITASAQNFVFDTGGNLTVPGGVTAASVTTPGSGGDITMTGGNITGGNNIVISGNIGGPGYNAPNFIQFNSTDPGFSIGAFADDVGNVNGNYWVQAQFEGNGGGNSLTRGFRLYDNSANTYPFAVDGTGTAYVPGTVNTGAVYSTGTVTGSTIVTAPVALGSLTLVAGARAIINDGNLVAAGNFGAQVAGGAGNTVPVWSDGTNWYIG